MTHKLVYKLNMHRHTSQIFTQIVNTRVHAFDIGLYYRCALAVVIILCRVINIGVIALHLQS